MLSRTRSDDVVDQIWSVGHHLDTCWFFPLPPPLCRLDLNLPVKSWQPGWSLPHGCHGNILFLLFLKCVCVVGGVSSVSGRPAAEDHRACVRSKDEQPRRIMGTLSQQADAPATATADERGVWTRYAKKKTCFILKPSLCQEIKKTLQTFKS